MDNLSTHSAAGALYHAFPGHEAGRILKRLEFHYTPRHASWLNKVEIEIGVLRGQCLDRRIKDKAFLVSEIAAWENAETTIARPSIGPSQPKKLPKNSKRLIQSKSHDPYAEVLGSVGIHREFMTAAARWIMAAKL
jgi:hypothetical protein